ncbi:SusC/RagA family TonB-linked outer membrane protein [Myroides odoratimimus]|uniref:SusC/RagA family TonB-linked outer membrane protein n=1 Tax=Myroides odoratimimus TaxID=76832 RepID=UPI00257732FA|nr:SusC/RagA family TonB-linked outer membrane protein [Myroides odoratimimus]MDM1468107.1 SusC/RagA family TonB-linked outer membrane protein [Myroides odoratimimus]MDM1471412.1 SusC/RagA family TonB-linked outer membrane protein [Myroides odoratimimus]MDM1481482.1 SusC/RagA family TonB-linked outer membrane protein [Myroides odoratimimus]
MKTQFLTFFGSRKAIPLIFLVSLFSSPIYAVSNDKHLSFSVSDLLQDTKQKPTIKLSGTVKDSFGALGGVIVTVGTTVVTTDLDGKYTTYITSGDKITFSMMGYKNQSIVFVGGNVLNITLSEDSSTLDEIVVNAGYYTVKDRERTGSIARVTAKDIELNPVVNPLQALQGRMAGVNITQYSGSAGGGFDIQIRGRNSLRTISTGSIDGNAPLYIIDGVPFISSNLSQTDFSIGVLPGKSISPLNSINPLDIESIEILKDADATAIYGSKGANGVVLITTKKGKNEKTSFTISTSTSLSNVANKMKLLNTEQFNTMRSEAFLNDKVTTYPVYAYDMNGTWDRNSYTDWQKELIGKTALTQNIKLDISGGNEISRFLVSAAHLEQGSVLPTDKKFKRNSINFNYNYSNKNNTLQINTNTLFSQINNDLVNKDPTSEALRLAPNAPSIYKPNGDLNWDFGIYNNPLAALGATYKYKNNALVLNLGLNYNLIDNLWLKLNTGINSNAFEELQQLPHTIENPSKGYTSANSSSKKAVNNALSFIIEPQLTYSKTFNNKHKINFLIGSTFNSDNKNALAIEGTNFSTDLLLSNIGAAKIKSITNTSEIQYKYIGFFSRLNYTYKDTYILNLTGRRDGSSRFGENKKFGNFGAIGTAWIFSNEKWFNNNSWLSLGKLRSSYGIMGSDNIGDYEYLSTYLLSTASYDGIASLNPARLFNPNFSWERTKKIEFALDLNFFNDRINTSIAFYQNRTSNQLVGVPLPGTTGFASIQDNLSATVENKGWEFTLNSKNVSNKDWYWTTSFNISFPKNTLLDFPNLESSTYANRYVVGRSTSVSYFYNYLGIDPNNGKYKFEDYNQDGKLTALEDKKIIKDLGVKYHGGFSNSISYKNFNLDFTLQYVKQYTYNYNSVMAMPGSIINQPIEVLNRWSPENTNSQYTYYSTGANSELNLLQNIFSQSTKAVSDASYIRLKNISLSYNISLPKSNIKNVRFYFQGQNLITFTNYFGLDPEFLVLGYLPPLKTYAFGIALTI